MAGESFSAQVDEWVRESKELLLAVARQSASDLVNQAQVPEGKGGKMRVDTGFLRASGSSSLSGMPYGPSKRESDVPGSYPSEADYSKTGKVAVDLANLAFGDTFYFGWTAEYARVRETYDGFVASAVQNWQQIVDANVRKAKR
jgi:hypothetical protein